MDSPPLVPWRTMILAALERGRRRPESRYAQLATVRKDGRPANRTVVIRGFLGQTNQLGIVTDFRSEKYGEIATNPNVELCWYFPETREQFRLSAKVLINAVGSPAQSVAWNGLSESGRRSFFWPPCGQPRADQASFELANDLTKPPANFISLALEITYVDYLDLRPSPHERVCYRVGLGGVWTGERLNP